MHGNKKTEEELAKEIAAGGEVVPEGDGVRVVTKR